MTHYKLTYEERRAIPGAGYIARSDFSARPTLICRTGDGHAVGSRDWAKVDCPRCLQHKPKA